MELYCGDPDSNSGQSRLVVSTRLSATGSTGIRTGTYSSAPLTALIVGSATLSPSFNRGLGSYIVEVPSDTQRVTLSATGLTGYQVEYIRNPGSGVIVLGSGSDCSYSYGNGTTTGIVLRDSDLNASDFQVDLNSGENLLGIALHKGDECVGASVYHLTVAVESVPATGSPTITGTAQEAQTLTASTSGISDEDGLDDVSFSYQWIRVDGSTDTSIDGATNSTYRVAKADVGKTIKVRVTFTDDAGNQESLTSAATATVTEEEAKSTDATLSALALSGVNFGTFASSTTTYTARVSNSVSQTTVTPTLNDSAASYVVKLADGLDDDGVVTLSVGSNVITVEVTAEDGETTKTYTVTVTRLDYELSTDATLSGLALSGIDFGTFASVTTSYTATVANSVSETTVTPTVNHSGASYVIRLDGVTDSDGTLALQVGSNVITVVVTAEDGDTTKTYTVTVTRSEPPSTDATLKFLSINHIEWRRPGLAYAFTYGVSFGSEVTQATIRAEVNHPGASYVLKVNGVEDDDGVVPVQWVSAPIKDSITIEVTAEDNETTITYHLFAVRQSSNDATLSALTLSGVNFGTFASGTISYTASVANTVSQTTVTPTVNDDGASYVIKLGGTEDSDGTVSLAVGSNSITVEVTAEDDSTTRTYTVTITRAEPPSTDATLSGLTLSGVEIGTFDSSTLTYTAGVANGVSQTTVSPTVNDVGASYVIKLGGVKDTDGTVSLAVGSNVITVEVTAEDGSTTRTYTVTVTRADPPSTDATLSGLTLSGVDIGTFASGTISYTASVANSVSQTTVSPTVSDDGASYVIKLGGATDADGTVALSVGSNVIMVDVTAEDDSTTRTYTVTVTRAEPETPEEESTDATLSGLSLSGVDFGTFDSTTTSYTASVANGVTQTTVTPTVNDDGASYVIKLDGTEDTDGTVSLGVGSNVITVEVTAEDDETTRTYTVTVTRSAPPSTDATLSGLTLSGVSFGTFASGTTSYSASVANSVSQTTVTPTVNDSGASYVIKLDGTTDSDGTVFLSVGSNVITVEVTAEDGNTTRTYTVTVTRAAPPSTDATLSGLTLSGVSFGTFDSSTTSYSASVPNSVTQTAVTPTVSHSGASYVVKLGGTTDSEGTVSLAVGSNVITVEVTAEDGSTTRTYTVTVTRAAPTDPDQPSGDASLRLLDRYDTNDNGTIDADEIGKAIGEYLAGDLPPSDMNILIGLYLGG